MDLVPYVGFREVCVRILCFEKRHEFLILEKGNIFVVSYEAKFHTLSRFAMKMLNIEKYQIFYFVKTLNTNIRITTL